MILLNCIMDYPNSTIKRVVKLAAYRLTESLQELSYKIYMSDVSMALINALGANSEIRWYDMIHQSHNSEIPGKSPEEIKAGIMAEFFKAGGE